MDQLTTFSHYWQALFGPRADQLAFETGFRKRPSKLSGGVLAQALVGGWLANPGASRAELASLVGVSKQALDQSLNEQASHFLRALLDWTVAQALAGPSPTTLPNLLARFEGVYVLDSSCVSLPQALRSLWPGCSPHGAALKLHVGLDLASGALLGPHLTPARTHDRSGPHQDWLVPQGALRVCDLGYFKLARFKHFEQEQAFYLSKVQTGVQIYGPDGQAWSLSRWLGQHSGPVVDCEVEVGLKERLRCRLIAWQVPPAVVSQRQAGFKEYTRKRQRAPSQEHLALSYWTVYLTNLGPAQLSPAEAGVLYRLRWQIELLFKLWKSLGQIDQSRSAKPWAVLCEVYAKLIGQVVQHWLLIVGVWEEPERSLVKAVQVMRRHLGSLLSCLGQPASLLEALQRLKAALARAGRMERRRVKPSSYQLLTNPPQLNYLI